MNIPEFTIRILLLFFPGIICSYIVDTFTTHKKKEPFAFLLQSFVFGLSSYFFFWYYIPVHNFLSQKLGWWEQIKEVIFLRALFDSDAIAPYSEIGWACMYAVVLGITITLILNYKIHFKILHFFKISKKFGELDVWGYTFNLEKVGWVTVRDIKNDLMYDGWVQAFSDDSKDAKLLLRDVSVYRNSTAKPLYQVGMIYLSRKRDDISIEIRTTPFTRGIEWPKKDEKNKEESHGRRESESQLTPQKLKEGVVKKGGVNKPSKTPPPPPPSGQRFKKISNDDNSDNKARP